MICLSFVPRYVFLVRCLCVRIILFSGDKELFMKAHKVILVAASSVFRAMLLSNEFVEGKENSLVLREIDHTTLRMVLRFVYTGSLFLTDAKQLLKLYQAGDRFDIKPLCESCLEHAQRWLSFTTCVEMLMGSWRFGLSDLHASCESYVLRNFEAVIHN